jgi:hypothetical protein
MTNAFFAVVGLTVGAECNMLVAWAVSNRLKPPRKPAHAPCVHPVTEHAGISHIYRYVFISVKMEILAGSVVLQQASYSSLS